MRMPHANACGPPFVRTALKFLSVVRIMLIYSSQLLINLQRLCLPAGHVCQGEEENLSKVEQALLFKCSSQFDRTNFCNRIKSAAIPSHLFDQSVHSKLKRHCHSNRRGFQVTPDQQTRRRPYTRSFHGTPWCQGISEKIPMWLKEHRLGSMDI
jgi:hypothetical protein